MANEVTIAIGAKANQSAIKAETQKLLSSLEEVISSLEKDTSKAAEKIKEKIKSLHSDILEGKVEDGKIKDLVASFEKLTKSGDGTKKTANAVKDIETALSEASESAKKLKGNVAELDDATADVASASKDLVSTVGDLDDNLGGVFNKAKNAVSTFQDLRNSLRGTGKIGFFAAIVVAATLAISKILSMQKALKELNRVMKDRSIEDSHRAINRELNNREALLNRIAKQQQTNRENTLAESKATRDLALATAELEAAKKRASARSVYEKNDIENEIARKRNESAAVESKEQIEAEENAAKQELESLLNKFEIADKEVNTAREKIDHAKEYEEAFYPLTSEFAMKGKGAMEAWSAMATKNVKDMFAWASTNYTTEEAEGLWKDYRGQRIQGEEEKNTALNKREDIRKELEELVKKLGKGNVEDILKNSKLSKDSIATELLKSDLGKIVAEQGNNYFDTMKKLVDVRKKEAEAAQKAIEAEQKVQLAAEKLARERELEDRKDRLTDMDEENSIALDESDGGYAAKKHAILRRAKLAEKQRDREGERYDEIALQEAERVAKVQYDDLIKAEMKRSGLSKDEIEELVKKGKTSVLSDDFRKDLTSLEMFKKDIKDVKDGKAKGRTLLQNIDESELSDAAKTARGRYETVQQNAKEARVTAKGRLEELKREGDTKTAELMMQSRKGGSRLTAMGLGGGDSPQKETAKNTRKMVGQLSKMVSLLEPGDKSLGANRSLGASWSIL